MSEVKAGQASGEHVRQGLIGVESSVREGVVLFLLTCTEYSYLHCGLDVDEWGGCVDVMDEWM